MNFFKSLRDKLKPSHTYTVELLVWNGLTEDAIARFNVTVEARSKVGARKRAIQVLSLRANRCTQNKLKVYGRDY
jgi:hypothetical protein